VTDQKQIDLLVRANIQGKKDLESVGKSIDSISTALDKQTAAAKRGESSLDELKGSMAALEVEKRKLSDNQALINGFTALSDRITKTEKSATKASSAYEKYKKELEGLAAVTDTQQDKLIRLSTASERAAARLAKQRTDQQALTETLREAGITTSDLAGAQDKLRATYAQYAAVFSKAQAAISSYSQDVREAREAEKALVAENTFQKLLDKVAESD
jgi:chromosome segregation ATPase